MMSLKNSEIDSFPLIIIEHNTFVSPYKRTVSFTFSSINIEHRIVNINIYQLHKITVTFTYSEQEQTDR